MNLTQMIIIYTTVGKNPLEEMEYLFCCLVHGVIVTIFLNSIYML